MQNLVKLCIAYFMGLATGMGVMIAYRRGWRARMKRTLSRLRFYPDGGLHGGNL